MSAPPLQDTNLPPFFSPSPDPFLFCRDLPEGAEAEAEEQPKQHGVARQREPGELGTGAGGEAPVLRGHLSPPPGQLGGVRDVPRGWGWGWSLWATNPLLQRGGEPGKRVNSARNGEKPQCRQLRAIRLVFMGS